MFGRIWPFLAHLEVTWGDMYFYFYFFVLKNILFMVCKVKWPKRPNYVVNPNYSYPYCLVFIHALLRIHCKQLLSIQYIKPNNVIFYVPLDFPSFCTSSSIFNSLNFNFNRWFLFDTLWIERSLEKIEIC